MKVIKKIAPIFDTIIFDWDYQYYLHIGGYGSGKSYHIALKIILKCLIEKRKVLVIREVFSSIYESTYSLFVEICRELKILETGLPKSINSKKERKVVAFKSPLSLEFPNGSRIIFKGCDTTEKLKSINDVSIIWIEEATEIKYASYKELLGRARTYNKSNHFILSCNPVGRENWIYQHFFAKTDEHGKEHVILEENKFYEKKELIKNGVFYHHSIPDDNPWLPVEYLKRLEEIRKYDYPLYTVARLGRFGASGTRVLPQLQIARGPTEFRNFVRACGEQNHFFGFDFGFEESYNAVISCAINLEKQELYIYDEIYQNKITDDKFAMLPKMLKLRDKINRLNSLGYNKMLIADNEDPKAIQYYRQCGYSIRGCRNKFAGSRLSNTRKIKRFKRIVVSQKCTNTIRELKDLTYKKDNQGNPIYDQFTIDPHTFSAIWYALDVVTVADFKGRVYNSFRSTDRIGKTMLGKQGAIKIGEAEYF